MQTAREGALLPFMGRAYAAKRGGPSRAETKQGYQLVPRLSAEPSQSMIARTG
jgi:hypothetical protein